MRSQSKTNRFVCTRTADQPFGFYGRTRRAPQLTSDCKIWAMICLPVAFLSPSINWPAWLHWIFELCAWHEKLLNFVRLCQRTADQEKPKRVEFWLISCTTRVELNWTTVTPRKMNYFHFNFFHSPTWNVFVSTHSPAVRIKQFSSYFFWGFFHCFDKWWLDSDAA